MAVCGSQVRSKEGGRKWAGLPVRCKAVPGTPSRALAQPEHLTRAPPGAGVVAFGAVRMGSNDPNPIRQPKTNPNPNLHPNLHPNPIPSRTQTCFTAMCFVLPLLTGLLMTSMVPRLSSWTIIGSSTSWNCESSW